MNFLNSGRSKLIGGVLIIVALCAGAYMLFGGLGGNRSDVPVTGPGNTLPGSSQNQGQLGNMFVARSVDNSGCPVQESSRLRADEAVLVGLKRSQIPQGTAIFARLYQGGRELEDTNEIVADQDINSCVWFDFTPARGTGGFDPGNYSAEIFVNGNRAGQVTFELTGQAGAALPGGIGGSSNLGDVRLGQAYIASQVDNNGCPANNTNSFFPDDPIYVAFERSEIPAGTEVFARLNFEGQPVEDADVILAERAMQSCFWFIFEPDRDGFNPGSYSVDVFVNGGRVESLPLQVR